MSAPSGTDFLAAKAEEVRLRQGGGASRAGADGAGHPMALQGRCRDLPPAPSLTEALRGGDRVAVMAEYKRRSPSAGALAEGEDPTDVASAYLGAGAAAFSILTDEPHFGGRLADLAAVVGRLPGVPVLRKDFLVDVAQLYEARVAGAAAVLLIVGMLDDEELGTLLAAGSTVGLECLVEVHDEGELERAAAAGATLLGINNRDLRALTTDLATTERLAPRAPAGAVVVSESGIRTADDVRRVRDAGAHAVLVGEALLRQPAASRAEALRGLAGVPR
jgi:indole-3-glycerol phosphate synthase